MPNFLRLLFFIFSVFWVVVVVVMVAVLPLLIFFCYFEALSLLAVVIIVILCGRCVLLWYGSDVFEMSLYISDENRTVYIAFKTHKYNVFYHLKLNVEKCQCQCQYYPKKISDLDGFAIADTDATQRTPANMYTQSHPDTESRIRQRP